MPPTETHLACPKCGYNLTGLVSKKCPECGTAIDSERIRRQGPPPDFDFTKWIMRVVIAPLVMFFYSLPPLLSLLLIPLWSLVVLAFAIVYARRMTEDISEAVARRRPESADFYRSWLFLIPVALLLMVFQLSLSAVAIFGGCSIALSSFR